MIISEKQIMQLMNVARDFIEQPIQTPRTKEQAQRACDLLNQIYNQQSEELKVINE